METFEDWLRNEDLDLYNEVDWRKLALGASLIGGTAFGGGNYPASSSSFDKLPSDYNKRPPSYASASLMDDEKEELEKMNKGISPSKLNPMMRFVDTGGLKRGPEFPYGSKVRQKEYMADRSLSDPTELAKKYGYRINPSKPHGNLIARQALNK
jgi:hypothetical protein